MKTTFTILLSLALAPVLLAQVPPPAAVPPVAPAATSEEVMRELQRRALSAQATPAAPATAPRPLQGLTPGMPAPAFAVPPATPATSTVAKPAVKDTEIFIKKEDVRFQEVEINTFLDNIYTGVLGRTIIRSPQLNAQTKITIKLANSLTKSEFIQLMETVLAMNGIVMVPIGEKFVKAIPAAEAFGAAGAFNKLNANELADSGNYITHVVELKYVRPSEVMPTLTPFGKTQGGPVAIESSGVIVLRDNVENVKRMLEIIERVDRNFTIEIKSKVIPIKYALAGEISSVLSSLTSGGGGTTTTGGLGSSRATSRGGAGVSGGGLGGRGAAGGVGGFGGNTGGVGGIGGAGYGGQPGYQQGGIGGLGATGGIGGNTGTFGTPGASTSAFTQRLNQIVNKAAGGGGNIQILGEVKIIADERTNSLLVFATEADMKTIERIIDQLDVVLAQVLIETIIMDVSLGSNWKLGVSGAQRPQTFGDAKGVGGFNNGQAFFDFLGGASTNAFPGNLTGALPAGFSYFGKLGTTFDVALEADSGDGRVNVIQKPRIQTSHATPASLFIGSTVPYVTSTYSAGGFGGGPSSSYQQLRVGIGLNVTPFINPDGLVVMQIEQSIDEVTDSTPIAGVGDVPNTSSRTLSAEIAVRDRETVILGGFIRDFDDKKKSGVPWLMDIPVLGNLFTSRSAQKRRSELIVLMRPTVLPTPEAASTMTRYETDNLPGVRSAERDAATEHARRLLKEGIDPNRPAPMFDDPRRYRTNELLLPKLGEPETSLPAPAPEPGAVPNP